MNPSPPTPPIESMTPPAAPSFLWKLNAASRSTGVKMFLILTLALLPLGLIALAASLQAIRTTDLEKEALLRVAVTQSARKLSADLAADRTAPAEARRFGIQIDSDNLHISQDVAVPIAFMLTELVELAMLSDPRTAMRISVQMEPGRTDRAVLHILSPALRGSPEMTARLEDRYGRILTGLSRQLRAPLEHNPETGDYTIAITVLD